MSGIDRFKGEAAKLREKKLKNLNKKLKNIQNMYSDPPRFYKNNVDVTNSINK
jgi:hypothetical protein